MSSLQPFVIVFLSIHILLVLSSIFTNGRWLHQQPSLKLRIARILLASCILSPITVSFMKVVDRPFYAKFVSIDALDKKPTSPTFDEKKAASPNLSTLSKPDFEILDYSFLFFILLFFGILYQIFKFIKDLRKLRSLLNSAQDFRSNKKITIKVSDRCLIPFATRTLNRAYIVLPISLLNSSSHMKMAIAHEGQHHRQGDCLWAYFIESLRLIFWGNPGVTRWQNFLNELQELSCDEALVGHQNISAYDYGTCLFTVAQTASKYSEAIHLKFACAVGMTWEHEENKKSFISRRICMLSQYQLHASRRSFSKIALTALAILAPLCTAYAAKATLPNSTAKKTETSSLDPRIQQIAEKEITEAVKRYQAKSGAIAVADPHTGQILAFAEAGSVHGNDSWSSRLFPAASTIKPFVAAAALEAGVGSESQIYDCHSPYDISGTKFTNWSPNFGEVSMTEAIAKSVNICLIKVAQDLGSVKFRKKLAEFGFDTHSQWRNDKSDALQLANAALGLSIPVSLETITKAYAILANKGHLFPENSGNIVSEASAEAVTRMLVEAVENGTGKRAAIPGLSVAGKTGTLADKISPNSSALALFGGYAPADAPRFAVFVLIEDGQPVEKNEGATGGNLAAPVFHELTTKSLNSK